MNFRLHLRFKISSIFFIYLFLSTNSINFLFIRK